AAEAALVLGAKDFISNRATWDGEIASHAALDCSNQTCVPNPSDDNSVDGFWKSVPDGVAGDQFSAMDSNNRPQYVVQLLGPCSPAGTGTGYTGTTDQNVAGSEGGSVLNQQGICYRITARALDPAAAENADRAQVFLQAT